MSRSILTPLWPHASFRNIDMQFRLGTAFLGRHPHRTGSEHCSRRRFQSMTLFWLPRQTVPPKSYDRAP